MSLVWREQLSVGNDAIDSDHRYLIEVINQVERNLEAKNQDELSASLDSLSKYSQEHFAREEKIAHAVGYGKAHQLSLSHEILFKQLDQAKREIRAMGKSWSSEVVENFVDFLRNWLINHVIKEDLLMKPSLQKHSPEFFPK